LKKSVKYMLFLQHMSMRTETKTKKPPKFVT
jgi:hypothetical protein